MPQQTEGPGEMAGEFEIVKAKELREGGYVIIRGRPCKIVQIKHFH